MKTPKNEIRGGTLRPNAGIADEFMTPILAAVRRMCQETEKRLKAVFEETFVQDADGGAPASQSRIAINWLLDKYEPIFNRLAKKAAKRMVAKTLRQSAVSLRASLKEMSEDLKLSTDFMTDRLQDIVTASVNESVSLIKTIPTQYLNEVQGAAARAITSGRGMADLQPFLVEKYGQNIRKARNVALDQTRKAFSNINAGRMQALGISEYVWIHTGGSQHPRKDHIRMNGNTYRLDDPPVIGTMYGQEVRGIPGQLPNCHCVMRPLVKFGS